MDKIGKTFRKSIVENYYRLLSVANLTVNKGVVPTAQKGIFIVYSYKSLQAFNYVQNHIQEHISPHENQNAPKLVNVLKKNIQEGIILGHGLTVVPLESLGEHLNDSVVDVENKLRDEYGINTNQWLFSMENLEMLEKINDLTNLTFKEVQHINKYHTVRYLTAWTMLQRFYLTHYQWKMAKNKKQLDYPSNHEKYRELKDIQKECCRYSSFANGTYGKYLNYFYSEMKDIDRLIKHTGNTEDFVFHTKIKENDVLHSFWDTTPYKPAHVIAKDHQEKSIVLCMRGTNHWADAATDLDFHYLSFSIMKEANSDRMFLKFHYNPETQEYLEKRLGEDTKELNWEVAQPSVGNEIVVETGYAHAGMLVSAIGAYKEITPKLEDILSKPEYSDYQLKITGHSLGGGMATLMVLLYIMHPPKSIKGKVQERLRGYSYGGASVLSLDFDKYLQEVMRTVVLGYDVVPRLSYGSIRDLCKIILVFDEIQEKDPDIISQVLGLDTNLSDFDKLNSEQKSRTLMFIELYEQFKRNHMDSLKLLPVGRVFHIQDFKNEPIKRKEKQFDFVLREIEQKEFFDEITFSKYLVKHHFPHLYEECLLSDKILYQRYLGKPVNEEEGTAASKTEVRPYTE